VNGCVASLVGTIELAHGGPFEQVSFIAAFLRAASWLAWPVRYPRERSRLAMTDEPEGFKWFQVNERRGRRHALPDLTAGRTPLPYLDSGRRRA
jgi:hypothetical protein